MRFPAPIAAPLIAAGLACAAGQMARAATLTVAVNHSLRLPVSGHAASVVVGNAQVADVSVIDSHTLFVTGKGAGSTDVAVVDPLGRTLYAADITVSAGPGRAVTVHRAGELAELSCNPRCLGPSHGSGGAGASSASPAAASSAVGAADAAAGLAGPAPSLAGALTSGAAGPSPVAPSL